METRFAFLLVLGLAFVAVVRPFGPDGAGGIDPLVTQTSTDRIDSARVRSLTTVGRTGTDLLDDFLGPAGASATPPELDILVATLPDPVQSHLDWSYDGALEGMLRAFQTAGYLPDRFWIPPTNAWVPRSTRDSALLWEYAPAVFLFRRAPSEGDTAAALRLLYVVGELPTIGLYPHALHRAFHERAALLRSSRFRAAAGSDTLRIIGPVFSGSSASLRRALTSGPDNCVPLVVSVVTGSATSPSNRGILAAPDPKRTITFAATVHTDGAFAMARDTVLTLLGVDSTRVAILTESATGYGNDLARAELGKAAGFLRMSFPVNVASVRNKLEQQATAAEAAPFGFRPTLPSRVPLALRDRPSTRETPAPYSDLTPAAVELVVAQIARTLEQHQIRLVGLEATDVRDKLFLAEEIRKRIRDVKFFTTEGNILFLRTDRVRALHGMLVFSTYPLVLENQWWTWSRGPHMLLANEGAQGIYNATLLQLGQPGDLLEYRVPGDTTSTTPPIWLTAVGSASMVPLRYFDWRVNGPAPGVAGQVGPAPPRAAAFTVPLGGGILALGLGVIALAIYTVCWLRSRWPTSRLSVSSDQRRPGFAPERWHYWSLRRRVEEFSLYIHREFYLALVLLALLCALLPAGLLVVDNPGESQWLRALVLVSILAGLIGLAVAASASLALVARAYASARVLLRWSISFRKFDWLVEVAARYGVALIGIAVLATLLAYGDKVLAMSGVEQAIFVHRAGQVDGEISPLVPLALAGFGFAAWAWWHLNRIRLLFRQSTFEAMCRLREGPPARLKTAAEHVAEIRHRLYFVIPARSAYWLLAALALLASWVLFRFGRTLEWAAFSPRQRLFDWLLGYAVLGTLAATPWAVYRLLATWWELRAYLAQIAELPLMAAFERLPERLSRLTRLTFFTGNPAATIAAIARVQWTQLRNIYAHRATSFRYAPPGHQPLSAVIRQCMRHHTAVGEDVEQDARGLAMITVALGKAWESEPSEAEIDHVLAKASQASPGEDPRSASTVSKFRRTFDGPIRLWVRAAEEYAAMRVVDYVESVVGHVRVLTVFLLLSLLLATAMLSSYPYHPQAWIKLFFLIVLGATVASLLTMTVQMNRDEVLSRITRTDPGRIHWDMTFIRNLVLFGVLPLVSLLTSEFPVIRDFLTAWMEPVSRMLGGR